MKCLRVFPLILAFMSVVGISSCGSNPQLQSISISPASATAQNGQAQFTASGPSGRSHLFSANHAAIHCTMPCTRHHDHTDRLCAGRRRRPCQRDHAAQGIRRSRDPPHNQPGRWLHRQHRATNLSLTTYPELSLRQGRRRSVRSEHIITGRGTASCH